MIKIQHATTEEAYEMASVLFLEYAKWLDIDLSFQHFKSELASLKSVYGPPFGVILLAYDNNDCIGCIAVRPISHEIGELKRMYLRPSWRNKGVGTTLLLHALEFAGNAGYKKLRLDTLRHMEPAMALYHKHGFREIEAYYHNPEPNAVYFEKSLVSN